MKHILEVHRDVPQQRSNLEASLFEQLTSEDMLMPVPSPGDVVVLRGKSPGPTRWLVNRREFEYYGTTYTTRLWCTKV